MEPSAIRGKRHVRSRISLRSIRATVFAEARPMTGSAKQSMPLRHCERSEAIHGAAQRKNGLLRRFAPRNDGKGWIASSLALLAMTEERGSSQ
jgi:hypothetical protein